MADQNLQSVLDALAQPLIVIGKDERILNTNQPARALIGENVDDRHFITALRQPALLDVVEATLRDRQQREARYLTRENNTDVTFAVRCAPISYDGGAGVLLSFQDMTHIEEAGQMRRDFVANVSHELRTPLTAVLGFIETMLHGPARNDPAARERFLTIMESEAGRMSRLVGDLASLNRVESTERVRPTEQVALFDLIHSTADSLRRLAERAEVELRLMLPEIPEGIVIQGDEDQLRQVLNNLVENAIKYGGDGDRIDISLSKPAYHPRLRSEAVEISVRDYGQGIDPVHLPRLTERFYRVDSHRSREKGGTGLGLAIVKHIIGRHRGRIQIESTPGKGAEFRVILPV